MIDAEERVFWDAVEAGYSALRADPVAWAAVESERKLWEGTLADGLGTERWAAVHDESQPPSAE